MCRHLHRAEAARRRTRRRLRVSCARHPVTGAAAWQQHRRSNIHIDPRKLFCFKSNAPAPVQRGVQRIVVCTLIVLSAPVVYIPCSTGRVVTMFGVSSLSLTSTAGVQSPGPALCVDHAWSDGKSGYGHRWWQYRDSDWDNGCNAGGGTDPGRQGPSTQLTAVHDHGCPATAAQHGTDCRLLVRQHCPCRGFTSNLRPRMTVRCAVHVQTPRAAHWLTAVNLRSHRPGRMKNVVIVQPGAVAQSAAVGGAEIENG